MEHLLNVASILGPAIELKNCIYEPAKRELGYFWRHADYVENLKYEARKLEEKRVGLQMTVDDAENNARIVLPEVKSWFKNVSDIQAQMGEIEAEIATIQNGGFSLVLHLRSLSKKVEKLAEAMKELQKSCDFKIISLPPLPAASVAIQLGSTFEFESRKHVEDEIMKSLRDGEVYKVGIWGMGGVGKTITAKRIMRRAREELLFEETVIVVVSQNVDMVRIQDDIARQLGLTPEEGSLYVKAHRLRTRLSESKRRSLIVVDDIWENLNLNDLGIPSCHSWCKMLITSRNRDILNGLNVDKIHAVKVLSKVEACHLFKLNVGSCINHPDVKFVAQQVVEECKGLPIALVSIGATLKNNEDSRVWNDLVHQLKSSNPKDLPWVLRDVYKPLRLSYEFLESKGAKSLFLLCCLFPEDHNIPLDELTFYAMGLGILEGINKLDEARNRVCSLLETLKGRFLLLEGYGGGVKMHDVVRDVAVFIASLQKLITTHSNDVSWISPYIGGGIGLHAGSRVFPNLHLLWIDGKIDREYNINDCLFEEMKELNVLSIRHSQVPRIPKTIRLFENLQTLVLEFCNLQTIRVAGELVNLKILICRWCDSIESLPMEIGRLSGLKLFELSNCIKLKKIPPGIISKLKELEELIVWECFDGWEANNKGKESENALLSELEHLSSLCRLKIDVKDLRLDAEQIRLSPNLMAYHIQIGFSKMDSRRLDMNLLQLKLLENISFDFGVARNSAGSTPTMMSAKNVATVFRLLEELRLKKDICDIDVPMSSNSFNNLQELQLVNLSELEHLNILSNFNMLSSLEVSGSRKLSAVMTRGSFLVKLKSLRIAYCDMMEQVLLWDEEEDQIVFQNLEKLSLFYLPNLTSFSKGIQSIGFPVLKELLVNDCGLMKSFVCNTSPRDDDHGDSDGDWMRILCKSQKFEFDRLGRLEVGGYRGSMCRNWCPMITAIFSRLSQLHVSCVRNMKSLFPYSVAQNLHNLTSLTIGLCDDMVVVIEDDACGGQTPPTHLLPNLETIQLIYLKKLKSFCECKHTLEFPLVTTLRIEDCDSMEEFTSGHVSTPILPHIELSLYTILNISNGVNASLKQRWLERQQEQNVEDSKRVEQSRKRGLTTGLENEFQSPKSRRMETEEEHREGSSVQEKMKAPIEIMEEGI